MSRASLHQPRHQGDRIADQVVGIMGSWHFIIVQTVIVLVWMMMNLWLLSRPFDPFPFVLLNLVFGAESAYASPLILMSQNRQAEKDKARDNLEAVEVQQIFDSHELLVEINRQQLAILETLQQAGSPEDVIVMRVLADVAHELDAAKTLKEARAIMSRYITGGSRHA